MRSLPVTVWPDAKSQAAEHFQTGTHPSLGDFSFHFPDGTVLGLAVTGTAGNVQWMLAVFVVCFPVLIAAGFFLLLWFKPHHLYAPSDFSSAVGVRDYIEAFTRTRLTEGDSSAEAIHRFWKPDGAVNRANQNKLRKWLEANNLKDVPITFFAGGEAFKNARQQAARDLGVQTERSHD